MGFVHPQTLATFTQQLQSHTTAPQSASHGLILWVILGALAFIFILAAIYRAQTRRPMISGWLAMPRLLQAAAASRMARICIA